jgi:hypothetical protein
VADAEATLEAAPGAVELEAPEPPAGGSAAPVAAPPAAKPAAEAKAALEAKAPRKPRKGKPPADDDAGQEGGPSVAAHPRAARSVARAKSWGALGGFLLGGYLSLPTHTLASAGVRAIVAGLVCYVAVWAGALFFWRRVVMLEIKAREQELVKAVEAASARNQAAAAQGAQAAARAQAAADIAQETTRPRR